MGLESMIFVCFVFLTERSCEGLLQKKKQNHLETEVSAIKEKKRRKRPATFLGKEFAVHCQIMKLNRHNRWLPISIGARDKKKNYLKNKDIRGNMKKEGVHFCKAFLVM